MVAFMPRYGNDGTGSVCLTCRSVQSGAKNSVAEGRRLDPVGERRCAPVTLASRKSSQDIPWR